MKDFSLNSGERQTAINFENIRYDHRVRYAMAMEFLQDKDNDFGLDIFCGNGYGSYYLTSKLNDTKVIGIDGSKEAIECAMANYSSPNNIFSYKLFPFGLPKNTFDFIICFESIEHIEQDEMLVNLLITALKPDGYLLLSVPNEEIHSLKLNRHPFHVRHYTPDDVKLLINQRLKLITWYGQDVYKFEDGIQKMEFLSFEEMNLKREKSGQVNIYIYKKRANLFANLFK